jgi:hypothetical protein
MDTQLIGRSGQCKRSNSDKFAATKIEGWPRVQVTECEFDRHPGKIWRDLGDSAFYKMRNLIGG